MRPLAFLSLLLVLGVSCYAENPSASKGIRTKIEATELDRRMLLENLNTHDQDPTRDLCWRRRIMTTVSFSPLGRARLNSMSESLRHK